MAEHKTILAEALVEAGLAYIQMRTFSIASLMAMQRQDWNQASSLLRSLIEQQGKNATPYSYIMLIRALRCNLEFAEALSICIDATEVYPQHPDIDAEFKVLTSILGLSPYDAKDENDANDDDEGVLTKSALEQESSDASIKTEEGNENEKQIKVIRGKILPQQLNKKNMTRKECT